MQILHMTLSREPFVLIARGIKKEEYRELKPFWASRLEGKTYTHIRFKNGYNPDSPQMLVEFKGLKKRKDCYAIQLGKVVEGTIKERLTDVYKGLLEDGYPKAAKTLKKALSQNADITIDDDFEEAHESGLTDYLLDHFDFVNNKTSFTALISVKE